MPGLTFGSFVQMLKARFHTYDKVTTSFAGQTVLITGANVGLGLECAHIIASLNPDRLILAVRNLEKGRAAAAAIETQAKKPNLCHVMELDMANFDSVTAFATALKDDFPLLDTAILNAGVRSKDYEASAHGWEMDLQVNALSTTLLSLLLIPHLQQTSTQRALDAKSTTPTPGHLTLVTSSSHSQIIRSELPPDNTPLPTGISAPPKDGKPFDAQVQYGISKLAIMWMLSRLARIGAGPSYSSVDSKPPSPADDAGTASPDVVVTAVCPGACRSTLARGFDSLPERMFVSIFQTLFVKPTAVGARIIVKAATLEAGDGVGGYWYDNKIYPYVSIFFYLPTL